eukprot:SM000029S10584  [mRNA]  locus=s29:864885:868277:- [translate_table: standard]
MAKLGGSAAAFAALCRDGGWPAVRGAWPVPGATAWALILAFAAFEALLMLVIPAKEWVGPVSPAGNRPVYKCNGFQAYVITLVTYLAIWRLGIFNPSVVYDHLGEIISALNITAFALCVFLYGNVAPSSSDWGSSGDFIQDFFWGMELYPRIGKWFDIKTFTNCRFGMMSWAVLAITYAIKQYEMTGLVADSMLVSVVLMLAYCSKFFYWESGYWNTMDIMHDRAGYYLCWGCMVWVPCIYTSPAMYLVHHPNHLGALNSAIVFLLGVLMIWVNYDSDQQRTHFRATHGKCTIWGSKPSKIEATYVTESGETKTSLLLTSGWWGLSRHFHYLPEILAAFFWTLPCLFNHILPYFYVVYLTILLVDRAVRDDKRCRSKYGKYWLMYCKRVPYKIIPGLY